MKSQNPNSDPNRGARESNPFRMHPVIMSLGGGIIALCTTYQVYEYERTGKFAEPGGMSVTAVSKIVGEPLARGVIVMGEAMDIFTEKSLKPEDIFLPTPPSPSATPTPTPPTNR